MRNIDELREAYDDRLLEKEGRALEEYMERLYSDESAEDLIEELWRTRDDGTSSH